MTKITSLAVFCGASMGALPVWREAAVELGRGMATRGIRLIYGGGGIGLMGTIADSVMEAGGEAVGVIPDFLMRREVANRSLTGLEVTDTMHTRKWRMFELADAFVSFAGGLGTLDETFEILTWKQLGLHDKPVFVCDVAGSAQALLGTIEASITMGFARPEIRELYEPIDGIKALLDRVSTTLVNPTT